MDTQRSLLFKVKKTQLEMLSDRGYDISSEIDVLDLDVDSFVTRYEDEAKNRERSLGRKVSFKDALGNHYRHRTEEEFLYVLYLETPKGEGKTGTIGKTQAKEILSFMSDSRSRQVILITEVNLSPHAARAFRGAPIYKIEHFLYDELTYNLTHHYLVPKHIPLSEEEGRRFLARSKLKFSQIPKLSIDDPVVRYYGLHVGTIVKVGRENNSVDTLVDAYPMYRGVANISFPK